MSTVEVDFDVEYTEEEPDEGEGGVTSEVELAPRRWRSTDCRILPVLPHAPFLRSRMPKRLYASSG